MMTASPQIMLRLLGGATAVAAVVARAAAAAADNNNECGLWLGPSSIKEQEDHGWGHSIFTGKLIKKGQIVLGSGILDPDEDSQHDFRSEKIFGDLFIPVYDWEQLETGKLEDFKDYDDDDDTFIPQEYPPLVDKATADADADAAGPTSTRGAGHSEHNHNKKKHPADANAVPEDHDPVLYQELWNGDYYHEQVLESFESMKIFVPGLSNIAPCTADHFNLEQKQVVTYRDWRSIQGDKHDESAPSHQAGSFSYWSNAMFVAARDIQPGEELVVECADNSDDFDPQDYPPVKFTPKEAGGYSICLDDKVEERLADYTPNVCSESSRHAGTGEDTATTTTTKDKETGTEKDDLGGGQRGVFAKKTLQKGEILTSSPMIPIHRREMDMKHGTDNIADDAEKAHRKQLLLNYCYGHPESSLLWLSTAPLLHAINHATASDPTSKLQPNAKITWHHDEYDTAAKTITRRQRFHHLELLEMNSLDVTKVHGMGLMMDLVATRTIYEDEEILIDYGDAWNTKWLNHKANWNVELDKITKEHDDATKKRKAARQQERDLKKQLNELQKTHPEMGGLNVEHHHKFKEIVNAMTSKPFGSYVTASDYNELHGTDTIRTVTEQHRDPYPSNLQTACYYEMDWLHDEINEDTEAETLTYESWYKQDDHFGIDGSCLLPCLVMERRDYIPGEEERIRGLNNDDDRFIDDDDSFRTEDRKPTRAINDARQAGFLKSFNRLHDGTGDETLYGDSRSPHRYSVKLIDTHTENTSIEFDCHLYKRFDYIYEDMPREGIIFVNKPHSTDVWLPQAFREPIGLSDDIFPDVWKDLNPKVHKKALAKLDGGSASSMRGKKSNEKVAVGTGNEDNSVYSQFFPPKVNKFQSYVSPDVAKGLLVSDTDDENEYHRSMHRWDYAETRSERLIELNEKNPPKWATTARGDL